MKSMPVVNWKSKEFLLFVLFLQFMFCATVFFDIPVARQVLGFFYFTFLPGFIILKLLKLDELDRVETVLFSVGLSVAFLMLAGLLVNEFGLLFGVSQPLSLMPLMIILNSFILVCGFLAYLRSKSVNFWASDLFGLHPFALLFIVLPILSVVGATWVNAYDNNLILLFMIIAISLFFVIGVMSKKLLPSKLYLLIVFAIAISLLYHSSLISNYVTSFGSDATTELCVFKNTQNNAYWGSIEFYPRQSSMLSITILPTLYSNLLNIDSTWTFKMLFPLIFSFVPLGLYQLWRKYIGNKYAFIAAFLFMAQETFYFEMVALNRQMIAELFFVLLLLLIMNKKMKTHSKILCFIIFSFGLATSHYGLSVIFLFFISITFVFSLLTRQPSRNITASMVVLFFVLIFSWYIYTLRSAVFGDVLKYGEYVYNQLGDFLNPASRGETVLRGLGLESSPTLWNSISRAFAYFVQFLIAFGFVGLVTKRIKVHFDRSYFTFILLSISFLGALILVPGLAKTLNMTRFYHILLFFLAPLSVIGAMFIFGLLSKRKEELGVSILLLIVVLPYFLFQTSFVYEVTGSDSWSVPLSGYRMSPLQLYGEFGYIDGYSAFGVQWLSKNVDVEHTQIYADVASQRNVLIAYGMMRVEDVKILSNVTKISIDDTVYLSPFNMVDGIIVGKLYLFNSTQLSFVNETNKIYANGECAIVGGT